VGKAPFIGFSEGEKRKSVTRNENYFEGCKGRGPGIFLILPTKKGVEFFQRTTWGGGGAAFKSDDEKRRKGPMRGRTY